MAVVTMTTFFEQDSFVVPSSLMYSIKGFQKYCKALLCKHACVNRSDMCWCWDSRESISVIKGILRIVPSVIWLSKSMFHRWLQKEHTPDAEKTQEIYRDASYGLKSRDSWNTFKHIGWKFPSQTIPALWSATGFFGVRFLMTIQILCPQS